MTEPIRVFIADDHPIVRRGIKDLIETEPGIIIVGEAENGEEALERIPDLRPDVVLMDLVMPVMNGIEAILQLKSNHPGIRILVLTSFSTDDLVFPAIKAGARGYLMKDTRPQELIEAIRKAARDEPTLHPSIAQKLLSEISRPDDRTPMEERLTEREIEVLRLLARGLSNQEIAQELVISVATAYTHVSRILAKLHLSSRTQAALYALREGLATLYESRED